MRINSLTVQGFVGITNLQLNPMDTITLIAGHNETGKTSVAQAIGFALRGVPERVDLKKDYGQLVNDAADDAIVAIDTGENNVAISIKKKSGKADGLPNPDNISEYVHCAVDMFHFANLDDVGRRRLLFKLGNVKASVEEVKKLVAECGGDVDKLKEIELMLTAGFDAAAKAAKERASDHRKAWEALTKERYGSEKAETWEAALLPSTMDTADIQAKVKELQKDLMEKADKVSREKGRLQQLDALKKKLQEIPGAVGRDDLKKKKQDVEVEIVALTTEIEQLKNKLDEASGAVVNSLACPDCGAALVYQDGELKPYTEPDIDEDTIQSWKDEINIAEQAIRNHRQEIVEIDMALLNMDRQAALTETYNELSGKGEQLDMPKLEAEIERIKVDLHGHMTSLQEATRIEAQTKIAKETTIKARQHHNNIIAWTKLCDMLSPDGIPAMLMSKALEPINVFLQEQATVSKWPLVQIGDDMGITYGGRQYGLISESAQWRAAAMLTAAIVYLSGVKFMLLDRADVLDLPKRSQMILWSKWLAKEKGCQIVICATLKERVDIDGIKTVWLGP